MKIIKSIFQNIKKSTKPVEEEKNYEKLYERLHEKPKGKLKDWDIDFLNSIEWKRYEDVCVEYLRIKNCNANVTTTGADGGVDIRIHNQKGTALAIAQCKSWKKRIGVNLVRELYGIMASEKIKHGIFLTTSEFSNDAIAFAKNKNLMLINSHEFVKLVNKLSYDDKKYLTKYATDGDYQTPTCVKCNVKMVRRTAKKGKNAGNDFWGCSNYPRCRNTMIIRN